MRGFASVFPFVEEGARQRAIGRLVANHDFVRALLRLGTFDRYLFSNPSWPNLEAFRALAEGWLGPERAGRLECVSYADLSARLAAAPPSVVHLGGWGHFMPGLHYVRARLAPGAWPLTAVIHSLHGRDTIDHAVRLNHAQLRESDAVFCTSRDGLVAMRRLLDATAPIAGRRFRGRLIHLPLGIDDDLLAARGDRVRGRSRLRVGQDDVVLLVIGRITPAQKMDLAPLLRCFALRVLPSARVPVSLVIAGGASPADLELVKATVATLGLEPRVRLHPNFSVEHRADLLAMSDVLVSPVDNVQETFGLSLLEAQGAGLPVVASRFDGYKDLVRDGEDGFLVDTWWDGADPFDEWFDLGDPQTVQLQQAQGVAVDLDQLAIRVLQLVHDPGLRERMGRAGREKVAAEYVWSRVIGRYEQVWEELSADAAAEPAPPAEANAFNVAPASLFSHYASRLLTDEDEVVATGEALVEGPYRDVAPWLRAEVIERVMAVARTPIRLTRLIERVAAPPATTRYVVRWLMKNGVVRVRGRQTLGE